MSDNKLIINILIESLNAHYTGVPLDPVKKQVVDEWLQADRSNRDFYNNLLTAKGFSAAVEELALAKNDSKQALLQHLYPAHHRKNTFNKSFKIISIAASLTILIGLGIIAVYKNRFTDEKPVPGTQAVSIPPIHPKGSATLALANGRVIPLSQPGTVIPLQGSTQVTQPAAGVLAYSPDPGQPMPETPLYNTVTTPRGGFYKVILPDQSVAYLNAASKLRFPTTYSADIRDVEISGEVFFEVTKSQKPFVVTTANSNKPAKITVLGTKFNITAYPDEQAITTTLVEGAVKVETEGTNSKKLSPGQQSIIRHDENGIEVNTAADIEAITSWTTGTYVFRENIKSVLTKISRWYNVEVEFKGRLTNDEFFGRINRNTELSEVITLLRAGGANIEYSKGKITVFP
ncbi:FecR family protein [Chitinophaga lutea]|uniref:FecR family protein n=1 Tax=Chitinophaga lutea TaxID=2488634 RepID=A0A3N4QN84_9BACT|nr:FecR family protein [Chitinophaga lutea]RPE13164.1 FecR family protein [Chitinophaga lutea]